MPSVVSLVHPIGADVVPHPMWPSRGHRWPLTKRGEHICGDLAAATPTDLVALFSRFATTGDIIGMALWDDAVSYQHAGQMLRCCLTLVS